MNSDTLFLLDAQNYIKNGLVRFCPACAMVEGYLSYYPNVMNAIDVVRVSPVRPRADIVELLGEDNQGSPVLVLSTKAQLPDGVTAQQVNGYLFINDERDILVYLGLTYQGGLPLSY
jgi:hypothetical protein